MIPKNLAFAVAALLLLIVLPSASAGTSRPTVNSVPDAGPAPIANAAPAAEVAPVPAKTPEAAPAPAPTADPQAAAAAAPAAVVPQSAVPQGAAPQNGQEGPNGSVKVLDTTAAVTDPAWFRQAYAEGFRLYVMHSTVWGTCTPWQRTQEQLKMALDAGLKIAVYTRDASCWENGIKAQARTYRNCSFLPWTSKPGVPR
ncbi:MAG TPA: hypothetical protein VJQ60_06165 [Arthrobacter sp.]|nr:hypothetical protein [Arthrobacter sp.]